MPTEAEFKPGVIQPGMERLIEAGETLEITDENGQVFAVTAKEGPQVMAFLISFDNWLTMKESAVEGAVINLQWADVRQKFGNLPLRVQRELPSFKTLGMLV
jgi:hypothetical protein